MESGCLHGGVIENGCVRNPLTLCSIQRALSHGDYGELRLLKFLIIIILSIHLFRRPEDCGLWPGHNFPLPGEVAADGAAVRLGSVPGSRGGQQQAVQSRAGGHLVLRYRPGGHAGRRYVNEARERGTPEVRERGTLEARERGT